MPTWLPERHVLAWYQAAFTGPAMREQAAYYTFLDRMMDCGFGRVRRLLLSMAASPRNVYEKSAELWRHDHTTGELLARPSGPTGCIFDLRDHVYAQSELGRQSIAEIYRYAISLTRAGRSARQRHALEGTTLVTHIDWA